eukprot:jgi/Mesvir1/19214/Mv11523-RA.1
MSKTPQTKEPIYRCVAAFDDAWYCFSPGNQMTSLYREGRLDDCALKFRALLDCASPKRDKEGGEAGPEREAGGRTGNQPAVAGPSEKPIWRLRTREEAGIVWNRDFPALWGADNKVPTSSK